MDMNEFVEKYINPFTDYGFKRLFGEEPNKDLLLDFLNTLLRDEQGEIVELTYLKNEVLGHSGLDRKAVFDLYCTNDKGEKFIVKLQKTKQKFFKDRTLYYSTFPIREQAIKGSEWNFELKKVYLVAILDFVFEDDESEPEKYRYNVKLSDIETHKVFYDKLTFIYLEMPKFNKTIDELENRFEKWMYVLKNLPNRGSYIRPFILIRPNASICSPYERDRRGRCSHVCIKKQLRGYRCRNPASLHHRTCDPPAEKAGLVHVSFWLRKLTKSNIHRTEVPA
jgi:hypothetical protein